MFRRLVFAAALASVCALAQPPGFDSKPLPARGQRHAPLRQGGPRGWAGGFGWWGPLWTSSFDYSSLTPPDKPKEMPVVIVNKEFQAERLAPIVREYGEGALPLPKRPTPPRSGTQARCDVVYRTGVVEPGRDCQLIDDSLRYLNPSGRRITVSLDLAEPR